MPRRNAGPTPATPPAPLNHQRTYNADAYESASERAARVNAENARRNPIPRGQRGSGKTESFRERPMPQMPAMPREDMRGLDPQASGGFSVPFRAYPNFGNPNAPERPFIPPEILDAIIAQSGGMGYEQDGQAPQGIDGVMADEIRSMMLQEMEQMSPEYGQEYGMDGTYKPYPMGPGNNRPQKPFLGQILDALKQFDQSLYRPKMFGPYPESLK